MGKVTGVRKQAVYVKIASVLDTPDPNGNRRQRRAAKKLKIKPEDNNASS